MMQAEAAGRFPAHDDDALTDVTPIGGTRPLTWGELKAELEAAVEEVRKNPEKYPAMTLEEVKAELRTLTRDVEARFITKKKPRVLARV